MDYENYMELYEALYFFRRVCTGYPVEIDIEKPQRIDGDVKLGMRIEGHVWQAILRILVVNQLLAYEAPHYKLTEENIERQQNIFRSVIDKSDKTQYEALYEKAIDSEYFFFDNITEEEYELYSRCDFEVTYGIGKRISSCLNLSGKSVLELGGNSGGLATALLRESTNCRYTVVDTEIPCEVGESLKIENQTEIQFVRSDIFRLKLPKQRFDCVIMMNLLHDFDDSKCLKILKNCMDYADQKTKFLIIEDVLTSEFEPIEVIMHGMRVSVECRGGKQRTAKELENLFSKIGYCLEMTIKIDDIHTLLVMG